MIHLHPIPDVNHTCPYCQVRLEVKGWYIPGMRMLASLKCPQCKREFYGDLPAGHGLRFSVLLEKETGEVTYSHNATWFAEWLKTSFAERTDTQIGFKVENNRPVKKPILLNCLDTLYGHSLLKLLNAQYYIDHQPDFDLIILIPRFLRWMVPEGVAEILTVDLPLLEGTQWNDWLAKKIHQRFSQFDEVWLSVAFSHPHPTDFDIQRFTQTHPFPLEEWNARMSSPTVTFIWREDRLWAHESIFGVKMQLNYILRRKLNSPINLIEIQTRAVTRLAELLRASYPTLDFAVAGMGTYGSFPEWIKDLRAKKIDETTERTWCQRYANSHVVVGVHGSNMLLPSAHAGATLGLMPNNRWGNIFQDILPIEQDVRMSAVRYRFVPIETPVDSLANVIISLLSLYPSAIKNFYRLWCDHEEFSTHRAPYWQDHRNLISEARAVSTTISHE